MVLNFYVRSVPRKRSRHEMTPEQAQAELDRIRVELATAQRDVSRARAVRPTNLRVSEKGGVSFYGLSRFPVTLYADQWETLLSHADQILSFIEANRAKLATKEEP